MARTIDERIVQMTFNNQEFESRARTTISTLGKLKSTTDSLASGDWLANIGKSIASAGLNGLAVTTNKISDGFNVMEQIAVGALRKIGAMAITTGTNLLKSLTIKPFQISWQKYDEGIAAEQSIMSAVEGKMDQEGIAYDMEKVVERVDKLKWYADETSYSITQMTNAVGQFTAAGQDLDMSVTAVMGIANACADAGVSTQKAESAFIGFSKAIGSGALSLGVWNMQLKTSGLTNSERFRKTLLDQAAEVGTLTKSFDAAGEAVYRYGSQVVNTANFTEFLNKGIITSEVLIKTLNKYSDTTEMVKDIQFGSIEALTDLYSSAGKEMSDSTKEWVEELESDGKTASEVIAKLSEVYEELGQEVPQSLNALRRAQEAISLSQSVEATAEAMTSQFSNIYHLMVGNYEEAKKLWSSVADAMNDWFVGPLYDLVDTFKYVKKAWDDLEWDEDTLGEKPVTQVLAIWEEFAEVVTSVRDYFKSAWKEIFGAKTLKQNATAIFNVLEGVRNFLKDINSAGPGNNTIYDMSRAFTGLLKVFRAIITIAKEFNSSFITPLITKLAPIASSLLEIFGNLGDIFGSMSDNAIKDLTPLQKVFNGILDILDPIINGIATFVGWIADLTSQNGEITVFGGLFRTIGDIFEFVGKAVKGTVNVFSTVGKALGDIFGNIKGVIGNFLESNGTNVAKIAEGGFLGYLAVGLAKIIGKLKKLNISDVLEGITNFFNKDDGSKGLIDTIQETFETLTNSIKTFTESIKIKLLDVVSNSLLKLAAALLIISLVDSSRIAGSLGAMAAMLSEVVGALAVMNKIDAGKGFNKTAAAFDQIAAGMILMAISLKIISSADPQQMLKTLAILGIALAEVVAFMAILNEMNPDKIGVAAKAFKKISTGLLLLSIALKIISSIDPERMISTLTLLGGSLLGLMGFFVITSKMINDSSGKKMESMGKALTNMGVGLIALSIALKIMASINTEEMSQALMGLILSLAAIGLFMGAMGKFVGGANFVAIAGGMLILSVALIGLGAALAIMGKMKLATIGKGLLTMAGALTLIGVAGLVLGPIAPLILLASVAIGAFGLALSAAAKGILEFMAAYTLMQAMGPNFASALIDVFEQAVAAVIMILPMLIAGIIDAIIQTADKFVDLVINLIDVVIKAVTEVLPRIIDLGLQIVMAFLTGIRDNIQQFATVSLEIIGGLINGLADGLPQLFDALFNLVVTAIDGLAEAIRNNAGAYGTAVGNLASALVGGIGTALWNAPKAFATNIWDGITNLFGGDTKKLESSGAEVTNAYMKGMESNSSELNRQTDNMSDNAVNQLEKKSEANTAGYNTAGGYIQGAKSQMTSVYNTFYSVGSEAIRGMKDGAKVRSPSRLAMEVGAYIIEGLANGMEENSKMANDAGRSTGLMVIDALSTAIDAANSILEDDLNPVITPVLDLSNVEGNAGAISDLMSANASLNGALAANPYGQNPFNQNGEKQVNVSVNFTVNNAGRDLSDSDVKRFGRQIANEVNEVLGGMVA